MIYVHRTLASIPEAERTALEAAANALNAIEDKAARKQFIKDNQNLWAAVRKYLSAMSYDKCWYSEAKECVSRYQVDHYRPHGRAKQAAKDYAAGYCWLAFDLENFRIAGVLSNTQNREHSDEAVGKGDWFPLVNPDERATLADRNIGKETPILLDPTDPDDPPKLQFNDDGTAKPSSDEGDPTHGQLLDSIRILGLDQNILNDARRAKWRQCVRAVAKYSRFARKPKGVRTPEEKSTMKELAAELMAMTRAESEFSAVARCCLASQKLDAFIVRNELSELSAEAT